jgi:hypothetical protein
MKPSEQAELDLSVQKAKQEREDKEGGKQNTDEEGVFISDAALDKEETDRGDTRRSLLASTAHSKRGASSIVLDAGMASITTLVASFLPNQHYKPEVLPVGNEVSEKVGSENEKTVAPPPETETEPEEPELEPETLGSDVEQALEQERKRELERELEREHERKQEQEREQQREQGQKQEQAQEKELEQGQERTAPKGADVELDLELERHYEEQEREEKRERDRVAPKTFRAGSITPHIVQNPLMPEKAQYELNGHAPTTPFVWRVVALLSFLAFLAALAAVGWCVIKTGGCLDDPEGLISVPVTKQESSSYESTSFVNGKFGRREKTKADQSKNT